MSWWDTTFALRVLPAVLSAFRVTLWVTISSFAVAAVLGLVWTLIQRIPFRPLTAVIGAFVEFIRDTPPLVQLYFLFFVLPKWGIALTPFQVGVIGLGLHYSTYLAESYRAGIEAVPKGQWEAATALNFPAHRTWLRIILPQAVPPVLPQLGNYLIMMFKESVLVSSVSLVEALGMAEMIGAQNFRYVEPYTIVGLLFLAVSYPSAIGVRYLERRTQTAFTTRRRRQKEVRTA